MKKNYYIDSYYSIFYSGIQKIDLGNYEDINEEVNNYKRLRKCLSEYLNNHPLIDEKYLKKFVKILQ